MRKTTVRNTMISILLVVCAGVVFGFMVYQVLAQGSQLDSQIESLQADRARELLYYKLQRISEESTTEREQLKSHYLIKESDSIDFLNLVEGLAPEVGVIIKTNALEFITEEDKTKWIKVSFSFTGSRERVQNFIQVLEKLPYVLQLTKTDMKVLSNTEWSADVTMKVQVLTYDE